MLFLKVYSLILSFRHFLLLTSSKHYVAIAETMTDAENRPLVGLIGLIRSDQKNQEDQPNQSNQWSISPSYYETNILDA